MNDSLERKLIFKVKQKVFSSFLGEACSQVVSEGYWQVLNTTGSWPPAARTSHAAMADQVNQREVFSRHIF